MIPRFSFIVAASLLCLALTCCVSFIPSASSELEIANRWQLRQRTSKFYNRASTKGRHASMVLPKHGNDGLATQSNKNKTVSHS